MIGMMRTEDLDEILKIEEEAFPRPWPGDYFLSEMNGENFGEVYVDRIDGHVVSYGNIRYMFENCDLTRIGVRKDLRHRGYGRKMLKHLIRTAEEKGCEFMHLEVDVNNTEAVKLYEKNRFMTMRTRKNYYENGDDAYDMARGLINNDPKVILAIESSCDETACAIVDEDLNVLSSVVTSQIDVHARFGGVIPEVASRMHVEQISTIVKSAVDQANIDYSLTYPKLSYLC